MGTTPTKLEELKIDSSNTNLVLKQLKSGKSIKNINGLQSNSASPTDTWIIYFLPEVINYERKYLSNVFCKISISSKTVKSPHHLEESIGLEYEMQVYNGVIKSILSNHVCKYFVNCYNVFSECTFEDLYEILLNDHNINPENECSNCTFINKSNAKECEICGQRLKIQEKSEMIKNNLIRNIFYIYEGLENRPSINESRPSYSINEKILNQLRFNIVMTENIKDKSLTFDQFIRKFRNADPVNRNTYETHFWLLYLQVALACYTFQLHKCAHNDLHAGNIFISPHNRKIIEVVQVNGVKHFLRTTFDCKLYDFDRAYVEKFGKNDYLSLFCKEYNQCNTVSDNLDFIKFSCYFFSSGLESNLTNKILGCICREVTMYDKVKEIYKNCLMTKFKPDFDYNYFFPIEQIIKNISKQIPDIFEEPKKDELMILQDDVWVIDRNFFKNGLLDVEKQQKNVFDLKNEYDMKRQDLLKRKKEENEEKEKEEEFSRPLKKSRNYDGKKKRRSFKKKVKLQKKQITSKKNKSDL